jgi:cytochrome P450
MRSTIVRWATNTLTFAAFIERRRLETNDDLIATLIAGEIDGCRLTTRDILRFCFNIVWAGNDRTISKATSRLRSRRLGPASCVGWVSTRR